MIMDDAAVHDGVTMVIADGFRTAFSSEVLESIKVVLWYEEITELLVIDVVDRDLCRNRGLTAGLGKPLYINI